MKASLLAEPDLAVTALKRERPIDHWRSKIQRNWKAIRNLARAAAVIGLALGVWLTWKQSGDLDEWPLLPESWRLLYNGHGVSRNIPAYFILALFALMAVSRGQRRWMLGALFFLAAALEFSQLMIPSRTFEWGDIFVSWIGVGLAAIAVYLLRRWLFNSSSLLSV